MAKRRQDPAPIEARVFQTTDEIDHGIAKLQRRISELEQLDIARAKVNDTGEITVARSNVREAIREIFGPNSPEFHEHEHLDIWAGPMYMGMHSSEIVEGTIRGRAQVVGILNGLIARLREKREDLTSGATPRPATYFDHLNLHPRIVDVSRDLFLDGHHWEAVFAAAKALMNYIKERSGRHDLDGAPLVRTVFSRNSPVLAFNDLASQTDQDEQEGMMHMFEGAVLAVRNPGGHAFPEGSEQRAVEYVSFLSLLAYRVQEARKAKASA